MYGIGDAGGSMLLSFPGSYLTLYVTDSLMMSAAFLGTMMLICRLLDGFSDILMGIIIDKTNTKLGKARPWFIASVLPLIMAFVLLFNIPENLGTKGKMVFIYIVYFLMTVVFYTINNIAYHAMLQRFAKSSSDRESISAVRSFLCGLFNAVLNVVIPLVIPVLGGEASQKTWMILAGIVGFVCLVCLGITALGIKERRTESTGEVHGELSSGQNSKAALRFLAKTRYFYIIPIITLLFFASFNMMGINYYYARDVLGNGELAGLITMASMVPSLFIMPLIPKMFKKYGKRNVIVIGLIVAAAASVLILINPYNLVLNIACLVIRCCCTGPLSAGVATFAGDVTDYSEKQVGLRAEGLTTSVYSVGVKIGNGIGGAIVAWGIALGGYTAGLEIQSDSTLTAMKIIFTLVPAVLYILGAVTMAFWDLDGKLKQQ